ncbi:MAG: aldo/keto reductase [Bifidobacteriaceae bacterium]|jgi:aryl-alcohol dehydrogenase-like predicted oxidoreductase|nr:aldo/keto reductase [Bifidobacteriaceae bacterium]
MKYRKLGEWKVSAIGLGAMPLQIEHRPDRETAINVIHRALELGINHIDTAFAYYNAGGTAENGEEEYGEKLVREAMESYNGDKSNVIIASKAGHYRYLNHHDEPRWGQEGNPRYILECGEKSREALGVDSIDLYYYHRPDRNTPYEESIEAFKMLVDRGIAKYIGVSNASIEQIEVAKSILGDKLIAVQNQFSPGVTFTYDTLKYTHEHGIAFVPWSPLGGYRHPNLQTKDALFQKVGEKHGVSAQQVILAWELAQADNVIPIPGFHRTLTLKDSAKAVDLVLSVDELSELNGVIGA